ncbi:pilus assembly protein CpaE [Pseudoxanthomonas sp. GM95]|uniref:AAA family ATPase n=1 Tax=Pseudoxanthomonas sp. GM95 TaxID=1881043 RepID=UPI0008B32D4B|nr:hypothetical protein [Pseudoxanthomonas sp. GM95]SEL68972.1 pilus assembly protein CpaE [Pseudoxanthomonas sp. GM95]
MAPTPATSKFDMFSSRQPDSDAPKLLLFAPDNGFLPRLTSKLGGRYALSWQDSRDVLPATVAQQGKDWDVLLLDFTSTNIRYSIELAQQLATANPQLVMVAVGTGAPDQGEAVLSAMRAGMQDFIDLDSGPGEVQELLQRVLSRKPAPSAAPVAQDTPAPQQRGKLVLLYGVRAGVGTSTLVGYLGVMSRPATTPSTVADAHADSRLVLDLGYPAADVSLYLGLNGRFHYDEALRNPTRIDATLARTAFAEHPSGVAVLGRAPGELPQAQDPHALIERLRAVYPLVLCDIGGVPVQQMPLTLLQDASEVWLVTDQSIGALVSFNQIHLELGERRLLDDRFKVIVNRYDETAGISSAQIAERFSLPVLATLPDRGRVLRAAASLGTLLPQAGSRDPYLRALDPLASRLGGVGAGAASPLQRLAQRLKKSPA